MKPNRIPPAKFARLWADMTLTKAEIAAMCGYTERGGLSSVRRKAAAMGLPPRPKQRAGRMVAVIEEALFRRMWAYRVSTKEMGSHINTHPATISNTARRLGLPHRRAGRNAPTPIRQFWLHEEKA